jgi:hypothetical protein
MGKKKYNNYNLKRSKQIVEDYNKKQANAHYKAMELVRKKYNNFILNRSDQSDCSPFLRASRSELVQMLCYEILDEFKLNDMNFRNRGKRYKILYQICNLAKSMDKLEENGTAVTDDLDNKMFKLLDEYRIEVQKYVHNKINGAGEDRKPSPEEEGNDKMTDMNSIFFFDNSKLPQLREKVDEEKIKRIMGSEIKISEAPSRPGKCTLCKDNIHRRPYLPGWSRRTATFAMEKHPYKNKYIKREICNRCRIYINEDYGKDSSNFYKQIKDENLKIDMLNNLDMAFFNYDRDYFQLGGELYNKRYYNSWRQWLKHIEGCECFKNLMLRSNFSGYDYSEDALKDCKKCRTAWKWIKYYGQTFYTRLGIINRDDVRKTCTIDNIKKKFSKNETTFMRYITHLGYETKVTKKITSVEKFWELERSGNWQSMTTLYVIRIQKIVRGFIKRNLYRLKRRLIIRIQKIVRGSSARKKCKIMKSLLVDLLYPYAIKIQKIFRGFSTRKNKLYFLTKIHGAEKMLSIIDRLSIIERLELEIEIKEDELMKYFEYKKQLKDKNCNPNFTCPIYTYRKNLNYNIWRIRDGPSFNNETIGQIKQGGMIRVLEKRGDWLKILYCKGCSLICDDLRAGQGIEGYTSIKGQVGCSTLLMPESGEQYLFPSSATLDAMGHFWSKRIKKQKKKINQLKKKLQEEKCKEEHVKFIRKEREVKRQESLLKKEEVKRNEVRKIAEIRIEINNNNSFGGNIKTNKGGAHRKWKRKSEMSTNSNISTGKKKATPNKDIKRGTKKERVKMKSISPKKIKRNRNQVRERGYVGLDRSVLPEVLQAKKYTKEELKEQLENYENKKKDEYKVLNKNILNFHMKIDHSLPESVGGGYIYIDVHKNGLNSLPIIRKKILETILENHKEYSFEGIIINIGSGKKLRPQLKRIYHNWENLENNPILNKFKTDLKSIDENIFFKVKEVKSMKSWKEQLLYIQTK